MVRRRTITYLHCEQLQLKRDTECDHCGRITRRERNLWIARGIVLTVIGLIALYGYLQIKGLPPNWSLDPLSPHRSRMSLQAAMSG